MSETGEKVTIEEILASLSRREKEALTRYIVGYDIRISFDGVDEPVKPIEGCDGVILHVTFNANGTRQTGWSYPRMLYRWLEKKQRGGRGWYSTQRWTMEGMLSDWVNTLR